MITLLIIIVFITVIVIYIVTLFTLVDVYTKREVPTNLVSVVILFLPILNTILSIYYTYPEYKETISKIFKSK